MSKRKLLLADDSITIQKVVNLTFADEGIEVISVGDGDSAMRKFDEFIPDLVMADVNMPGLNGYEVCRIIKVTEETRHIPVILLVGSFEPFDEAEAKEAGADDFLTKPFQSIRQLVNKVTDLLNRSANASEETTSAAPVVDSFAETLEFNKEEMPESSSEESAEAETSNDFELRRSISNNFDDRPTEISSEFGDAGMDDEMIEASPANDYTSDSDSVYQRETTIDYAKTQPLNAEDLKGFEMISGENTGQSESSEAYEIRQPITDSREESSERSEPASFDEEARKLSQSEDYSELQSYPELQNEEVPNGEASQYEESSAIDEEPDNLSETEPQVDYYLPNEPEFEKEITDAETLAPEISYAPEDAREADFSQAEISDSNGTGTENTEASNESTTTPYYYEKNEFSSFEQPHPMQFEPQKTEAEPPPAFAVKSDEEPETTETTADSETVEYPVSYAETETQTDFDQPAEVAEVEEAQIEQTEDDAAAPEQAETEQAEAEEVKSEEPEVEEPETEEPHETIEAEEPETDVEKIDETPIFASESTPAVDFDDGDLLELPPLVEETGIRPQPKAEAIVPEVVAETPAVVEPESKITVTKTVAESEIALSFPPELIEAIAQKVADKISAKAMTDVLPQITELVMKKLAEENQESKK